MSSRTRLDRRRLNIRRLLLPLAVSSACQLAAVAQTAPAPTASRQSPPAVRFLRPIRGEHFTDLPIFIQVDVSGFHLIAPDKQRSKVLPPNTGHIRYSMDDFPICGTDGTQVMIGKFSGDRYVPVGWHVLRAELVDVNGNPLNPPVKAETAAFSGHPATVETDHVQGGSLSAELNAQELYKMRMQLQDMQKELLRIRTGNSGFVPIPASGEEHRE
jgi:hypothetical protein